MADSKSGLGKVQDYPGASGDNQKEGKLLKATEFVLTGLRSQTEESSTG